MHLGHENLGASLIHCAQTSLQIFIPEVHKAVFWCTESVPAGSFWVGICFQQTKVQKEEKKKKAENVSDFLKSFFLDQMHLPSDHVPWPWFFVTIEVHAGWSVLQIFMPGCTNLPSGAQSQCACRRAWGYEFTCFKSAWWILKQPRTPDGCMFDPIPWKCRYVGHLVRVHTHHLIFHQMHACFVDLPLGSSVEDFSDFWKSLFAERWRGWTLMHTFFKSTLMDLKQSRKERLLQAPLSELEAILDAVWSPRFQLTFRGPWSDICIEMTKKINSLCYEGLIDTL